MPTFDFFLFYDAAVVFSYFHMFIGNGNHTLSFDPLALCRRLHQEMIIVWRQGYMRLQVLLFSVQTRIG